MPEIDRLDGTDVAMVLEQGAVFVTIHRLPYDGRRPQRWSFDRYQDGATANGDGHAPQPSKRPTGRDRL